MKGKEKIPSSVLGKNHLNSSIAYNTRGLGETSAAQIGQPSVIAEGSDSIPASHGALVMHFYNQAELDSKAKTAPLCDSLGPLEKTAECSQLGSRKGSTGSDPVLEREESRPERYLQNEQGQSSRWNERRSRKTGLKGPRSDANKTRRKSSKEVIPGIKGITFYKRIGRWTAHLWAEGEQHYLGSYPTATEAARAYDKCSLKYFGEKAHLNNNREEYNQDLEQMNRIDNVEYKKEITKNAQESEIVTVAHGVRVCPKDWYEVIIKERAIPKRRSVGKSAPKKGTKGKAPSTGWRFLGRFRSLEDAKRCYQMTQ